MGGAGVRGRTRREAADGGHCAGRGNSGDSHQATRARVEAAQPARAPPALSHPRGTAARTASQYPESATLSLSLLLPYTHTLLPLSLSPSPGGRFCEFNPDPAHNTCAAPQEPEDPVLVADVGDAGGGGYALPPPLDLAPFVTLPGTRAAATLAELHLCAGVPLGDALGGGDVVWPVLSRLTVAPGDEALLLSASLAAAAPKLRGG